MLMAKDRKSDRHKNRKMVRIPDDLADGLAAYQATLPHDPGRPRIVRDILRAFLVERGFIADENPAPPGPSKKPRRQS